MTTTSKRRPAIASIDAARLSIGRPSVEEDGGLLGRRSLRRRPFLLAGSTEMEESYEALIGGQPDGGAAGVLAQQGRRSPVAREAASVGGKEDDVGRDGGRVEVLLVLDRVAAERGGADDHGRCAVELGGPLGPGRNLQAAESAGADDAKAPGRGEVMVGGPAGEVEELFALLASQRLRAEGLVGAARADRCLDVHRRDDIRAAPATRRSAGPGPRGRRLPEPSVPARSRSGPRAR